MIRISTVRDVDCYDIQNSINAGYTLTDNKIQFGGKMEKIFDGKKTAKLGTETNPAVVIVQTEERVKELASVFDENGWKYKIELEPDKPEDIEALEILLNPIKTKIAEKKMGRNEPCPCGSGKKYKKCCGNKT